MESSWPENLPSNRKKAVQELIQGRELTNKLRQMLDQPMKGDGGSVSVDSLVAKILGTFTETLSILNSTNSDEFFRVPATTNSPASWEGRKSEDSGESIKTSPPKNRRGCYKRRKTSETVTRVIPTLIDDGHAWRKYGQKGILNSKHQRNYYRCTHKFDQGCQATKQVQKTEDEPPKFRITYHGHHTCRNLLKAPQIIFDSPTSRDSSILLCFESKGLIDKKPNDTYFPSVKHEYKEDFHGNLRPNQSSSSDYYVSSDLTTFGPSVPVTMMSSGSNHGDVISSGVYSCTTSTHSFEDILGGNGDFGDFQFEIFS